MRNSDRLLRGLARVLPREFRERVFEPALADIQLDEVTTPRPFARTILLVECFRLGMRQHLWHRGRPTGIAVALVVMLVVGALVASRLRYAADWKAEAARAAGAKTAPAHPRR
jgi:hypothetical protein